MTFRCRTMALACLGTMAVFSAVRAGVTCGFVAPAPALFRPALNYRPCRIRLLRMTASTEPEERPYSDLPANWRAPLQRGDPVESDEEAAPVQQEDRRADMGDGPTELQDVRTSAQVLEEVQRVGTVEVGGRRTLRKPDAPPDIGRFQTDSQRRRSLPLSKLKRVKPKRRRLIDDEEGELRPLVPKTDRESVLRGEDYWIDYREVDERAARKEARRKAPSPDQFAQSKMRAEIVNPYKQNWILAISLGIMAMAGFIKLNPGILDDAVITFPSEL